MLLLVQGRELLCDVEQKIEQSLTNDLFSTGAAINTDDENEEEEYEAWKVRELKRIKNVREAREAREKEVCLVLSFC